MRPPASPLTDLEQALPVPYWIASETGEKVFFSPLWNELTGVSPSFLVGNGWHATIHPEDLSGYQTELLKAVHQLEPVTLRARHRTRTGDWRWRLTHCTPKRAEDGKVVGFLGISIDAQELWKEQLARETSAERLEIAVSSAEFGIFDWDCQQDILFWNEQQFQIFGRDRERFTGKAADWEECVHPEERDNALEVLSKALKDASIYASEFRIVLPDGSTRLIQGIARIIRNDSGEPTRVVGINRNITNERELYEQLRRERQRAEEASASKNLFLANMSHEIRTPMNSIITLAELALEGEMSPESRENVETVVASAESLLALLNDILDYSKLGVEELRIQSEPTNLRELVNTTIRQHQARANQKQIHLESIIDESLPKFILIDSLRTRQILMNLLSNAVKFTPDHGSITLHLLSRQNRVTLSVEDTGVGIPSDKLDTIFQPFQQADASTSRRFGGTGLGLSISRKLAELMGGTLSVESTIGVGSRFSVTLPLLVPTGEFSIQSGKEASSPAPKRCLESMRILVAEDNSVNQIVISKILSRYGITPVVVENGERVLELFAAGEQFDLIFMDCQMPVMNGYEATKEIRLREEGHDERTPIVALTANALPDDRELCFECGMDDYLSKPLRTSEFEMVLYRWADRKAALEE